MTTQTQKSAHKPTPPPWQIAGPGQIFDIYGNEIAACKSFGAGIIPAGYVAPWHQSEANAAFIVRACNSHAALVEALEAAINARASMYEWRTESPHITGKPEKWVRDSLCEKWRAALNLAQS